MLSIENVFLMQVSKKVRKRRYSNFKACNITYFSILLHVLYKLRVFGNIVGVFLIYKHMRFTILILLGK